MLVNLQRALVWFVLLFASFVQAECVTVTGSAALQDVDEAYARQMAIRNALELAVMQNNMQVQSRHDLENFALQHQSIRFTARSKVERFNILSEYADKELGRYEVELNVCLEQDLTGCGQVLGAHYQNKVVIAPVVVEQSYEARDIANLLQGYQLELDRRLRDLGYANLEVLDYVQGLVPGRLVSPNLSPDVLRSIQDQTGGQFLLLSVIRSVMADSEGKGVFDGVKRFYNLEVKNNRRYIEVEWYLVDLFKHRIVRQELDGYEMHGDAAVGREKPFGTAAFFKTHTGQAFNALLGKQVSKVFDQMRCQILETEVIDVRNGDYVLFLAEESGVQVGDQLAVYQRFGNPVRLQGRNLGFDEQPAGFLKIKRILPKFAVADLIVEKERIQIGDVVRSW